MNILRLLVLLALGWFCWRTIRGVKQSRNDQERALAIRGAVVFWILSLIFVVGMFALPGKGRILLAIPLVLVMGSAWRAYRNSRQEIQERTNLDAKLQRMKKVN